jgi:hypothetical protein
VRNEPSRTPVWSRTAIGVLSLASALVGFRGSLAGEHVPALLDKVIAAHGGMDALATRLKPEGGNEPFAILAGFVLVVTSYNFVAAGLAGGTYGAAFVAAVSPAGELGAQAGSGSIADSNGLVRGAALVPSGLIVKPPANLCFSFDQVVLFGAVTVHGFFAKDQ